MLDKCKLALCYGADDITGQDERQSMLAEERAFCPFEDEA